LTGLEVLTATKATDLRRAPLSALRAIDFRAPDRDFWSDEAALWDRQLATVAGLDEAAWRLPGAAPSDAGGPEWSLLEHVAHLTDWQEIAVGYLDRVLAGGDWPTDDDYDGGDFDRFNERRRSGWTGTDAATLRRWASETRAALLPRASALPAATLRGDDAWGWVYMVLHGHVLDHLGVIEPWAARLRARQAEGDPLLADPRPAGDGSTAAIARFWAAEEAVFGQFDELVRPIPADRWEALGPTADWTLKDHVAHLARWFEEGATVIAEHRRTGLWRHSLTDGLDAWNAREVAASRAMPAAEALRRFDAGRVSLAAEARTMAGAELASPEAGEWVYECLHGHVRQHLAMVGRWCVAQGWPRPEATDAGPRARNGNV
jgi:hypothetical protein